MNELLYGLRFAAKVTAVVIVIVIKFVIFATPFSLFHGIPPFFFFFFYQRFFR